MCFSRRIKLVEDANKKKWLYMSIFTMSMRDNDIENLVHIDYFAYVWLCCISLFLLLYSNFFFFSTMNSKNLAWLSRCDFSNCLFNWSISTSFIYFSNILSFSAASKIKFYILILILVILLSLLLPPLLLKLVLLYLFISVTEKELSFLFSSSLYFCWDVIVNSDLFLECCGREFILLSI